MKNLILMITFIGLYILSNAQSKVDEIINKSRLEQAYIGTAFEDWLYDEGAFDALTKFEKDTNPIVRIWVLSFKYYACLHDTQYTHSVYKTLIAALLDEHISVQSTAINLLKYFPEEYFIDSDKNKIYYIFKKNKLFYENRDILLLIGVAQMNEHIPELEHLSLKANSEYVRLYAKLSLARMGHEKALSELLSNPNISFSEIAYTMQKPALMYLKENLFSLKQEQDSGDDKFVAPSEQALGILKLVVQGFPSTDNVEQARVWVLKNEKKLTFKKELLSAYLE
ncbi:MAG: hypothetical protein ACRCYT_00595 [Cetobacterium sp.]